MKIKLNSILVEDQDRALAFYTEVLGFKPSKDIPVGEFRWITVVSPEGHPDVELVLEPNANPIGKAFQEGLFQADHRETLQIPRRFRRSSGCQGCF